MISFAFRGATVHAEVIFFDIDGGPASPASAEITFNYINEGERVSQSFAMSFNVLKSLWQYDWNSEGITPGTIEWSIRSDPSTQPVYVADGCFELSGNAANLNAT